MHCHWNEANLLCPTLSRRITQSKECKKKQPWLGIPILFKRRISAKELNFRHAWRILTLRNYKPRKSLTFYSIVHAQDIQIADNSQKIALFLHVFQVLYTLYVTYYAFTLRRPIRISSFVLNTFVVWTLLIRRSLNCP